MPARIAASYNDRIRAGAGGTGHSGPACRVGGVEMESRAWFNENLESRNFYVPAVIANIVLIITMLLSSMAVVREKEIGTMEQIIVTPIRRSEFILGKTIPFVLIGFIDVALITLVAAFWFDVPHPGEHSPPVRRNRPLPHEHPRLRPASSPPSAEPSSRR